MKKTVSDICKNSSLPWIYFSITIMLVVTGILVQNPDATAWGLLNAGVASAILIWHETRSNTDASKTGRFLMSVCTGLSLYVTVVWILWKFGIGVAIGAIDSGAIEESFPAIAGSWVLSLGAYWGYRNNF